MAFLLEIMGNYDGSLEIYSDLRDATNDEDEQLQPLRRMAINHLMVNSYLGKGEYSSALSICEQSIKFCIRYLPPDDQITGVCYQHFGTALMAKGDYSASLDNYIKALKIYQKNLPPEDYSLGIIHSFLGIVQCQMNDFASAKTNLQKAFHILEKQLPYNHPNLAAICTKIAH